MIYRQSLTQSPVFFFFFRLNSFGNLHLSGIVIFQMFRWHNLPIWPAHRLVQLVRLIRRLNKHCNNTVPKIATHNNIIKYLIFFTLVTSLIDFVSINVGYFIVNYYIWLYLTLFVKTFERWLLNMDINVLLVIICFEKKDQGEGFIPSPYTTTAPFKYSTD